MITLPFVANAPTNRLRACVSKNWEFQDLITSAPTHVVRDWSPATQLAYATVHYPYPTALAACDPQRRNKSAVAPRHRPHRLEECRHAAGDKVYTASVTDAQRWTPGPFRARAPFPVPAPTTCPVIEIVS